jgi:hypothetical protein
MSTMADARAERRNGVAGYDYDYDEQEEEEREEKEIMDLCNLVHLTIHVCAYIPLMDSPVVLSTS